MKARKRISSKQFDAAFDAGENVAAHLDVTRATRPGHRQQRLSVDAPPGWWSGSTVRRGGWASERTPPTQTR